MSANQRAIEHGDTGVAGLFAIDPAAVKIGKEIGKGAFSVVFSGEYNKKHVAVKCQPKDEHGNIPQFVMKEVEILQKLRHKNILEFIGAADNRKTRQVLILSEHSNNGDLEQLLQHMRSGQVVHVGWKQIVQMALDIARGVEFLHASGMIHRDIKSSNILLGDDLCAKLCDFGFATETKWWYEHQSHQHTQEQPETATATAVTTGPRRKSYCGTDAYMAPEMFLDEDYNENVDVFSFGVVLMELLCCRQANKDGFLMRLPQYKFQIRDDEFRDALPFSCPESVARFATKCVSFEPSERPTIEQVVKQLELILSGKELVDATCPVELRPFTASQRDQDVAEREPQLDDEDDYDDEDEEDDEDDEDYDGDDDGYDDDSGADTMEIDEEEEAAPHDAVLPPALVTGTLWKRNRRGKRGWSEKVFTLDRDHLHYTDAAAKQHQQQTLANVNRPLGRRPSQPAPPTKSSLCLKDCRIWKTMEMPELCFNVVNGSWKIVRELRATTRSDLDHWMAQINQGIDFANDQAAAKARTMASVAAMARNKHKSHKAKHNNGHGSASGSRERRASRGSRGSRGSRESRGSRGSRGSVTAKRTEERRPETAAAKNTRSVDEEEEDAAEDQEDEVFQWLKQVELHKYTAVFKAKGFATVDFIRETGIETDDLNFLGIKDPLARKTLMRAARTLRGEDE